MIHPRLVAAFLCLLLSVLGVCVVSYLDILDMDSLLVEVSLCLPGSCNYQLQSRCLKCTQRYSEGDLLISRQRREDMCKEVVGCLYMCGDRLVNICQEEEEVDMDMDTKCEDMEEVEVMGYAGGDPVSECENTVEATMAGMRKGMDSVHIDLSITKDGVPFLWRDHDPRSLSARMRQLGVWGVERCRPALASDMVVPAHDITWQQARSAWHYVGKQGVRELISYKEWLEAVAELKTGLRNIWLEFRVPSNLLATMVRTVWDITNMAGMEDRLFFKMDQKGKLMMKKKIVIVKGMFVDVESMSTVQREAVERVVRSQVVGLINDKEDEALYKVLESQMRMEISSLEDEVMDLTSVGYKVVEMGRIVDKVRDLVMDRDLVTRDQCDQAYTMLAVSTVNNPDMMRSLVCLGVDLLVTSVPSMVRRLPTCARDRECPYMCDSSRYSPVCGSDGNTYSSSCWLKLYSCLARVGLWVVREGVCGW